jgi:hypothetical protein
MVELTVEDVLNRVAQELLATLAAAKEGMLGDQLKFVENESTLAI